MNNLPPLEDLRVFCLVAQRASFVAAAEELGNSPAYVSKRVKALEQAKARNCCTGARARCR
ncbi:MULTISPECIES: helix-turn-helix domain-containing protein [Cupriavidus]|uniref:HTH lysR-type domain-containing protein n=1 Tax=Cupriavidus pinatubonensis (strain JMP 134 / LMG 1197) TaxID=264198 RepID=Q46TR4_CUPPJ|nr:LysR family transcriptional regulator [Cupriavidus pinatubonensis]